MKKFITSLTITTAIITALSGCSERQSFKPASIASDIESGASPEFDFQFPSQPDTENEEITVPVTSIDYNKKEESTPQNAEKETEPSPTDESTREEEKLPDTSETISKKDEASSVPEIIVDNSSDSNHTAPDKITEQSNNNNKIETPVTEKPETSTTAKPETPTTKPDTSIVTKPETTPSPTPSTNSNGITSSDITSFYPDNFNCENLMIGETHKPTASVWLNNGYGKAYSSDESVVTVSNSGVVTAKGEGTAYVKIVGSAGMSKMYRYTVKASGITEDDILGFYPDDFNCKELTIGETHKPSASVWLKNGNGKVYSSDESVVTVNSNGVVTARGEGVAYIKIVGSTGMSEMYMYIVDSDSGSQDNFEALFDSFQW